MVSGGEVVSRVIKRFWNEELNLLIIEILSWKEFEIYKISKLIIVRKLMIS